MLRPALSLAALLALAAPAHADSVFDICKGESKTTVTGAGKPSIAVIYLNDFPVTTTPAMRNAVGASIARAEKAKIVPAKDVEAAKRLVDEKRWSDEIRRVWAGAVAGGGARAEASEPVDRDRGRALRG